MAYEKQDWKDALQAAKSKGGGFDDSIDQRIEKKKARLMYTKRLLEKEIKKLLKNKIIKYGEIVRLHRKYGVQSTGTL